MATNGTIEHVGVVERANEAARNKRITRKEAIKVLQRLMPGCYKQSDFRSADMVRRGLRLLLKLSPLQLRRRRRRAMARKGGSRG